MIGSLIDGKYEVHRLLGQGGMGAVYAARHTGTDRQFAVKVIQHADVSKQSSLILRLQREARAAGSIDSPHIGQVVDAGTDEATSTPYLVMELLEGEDLQQLLHRTGPLRPDVALRVVAQAALGLAKAHEARVVHRDIKPANLFLARQQGGEIVVKVLDFGIAKVKHDDLGQLEGSLTRTGSVLGSPLYMSPEQARGTKGIDHRADVWSLGVVAYQVLTGRTPYQEIDALGELILAICSELPPCVQDFAPWVDLQVAATVHRALSLDATERFQTATDMHEALVAHLPALANGKPDLRLEASMFVAVEEDARSISAPRLFAEVGRRPAFTGRPVSQHVITPAPTIDTGDLLRSDAGARQSSPHELAAGPTLMVESLSPFDAVEGPARRPAQGSGERSEAATRQAARSALPVPLGTDAGVSHSSPGQPPPRRMGTLIASAALAALIGGAAAAFLMRGAIAGDPVPASPPTAAEDPTEESPTGSASALAEPPIGAATAAPPEPQVAPSATASVSPPAPASSPVAPVAPPPHAAAPPHAPRPPAAPPKAPPAPPPTAKPLDNSGFGDRK